MWYADIWNEAVGGRVDAFAASMPVLDFFNWLIFLFVFCLGERCFFVFQKTLGGLSTKLKITSPMEPAVANGHSTDSDVLGE
ncbi:hypothetical protein [Chitinivorax sp. B]|uniref:hypothetical protein n=1 Tax=Chitinivorax sp. B TaxID=2502235 RepID=UPI0010F66327|nr:hypothetical protein [Chitinivorax sp. B]